MPLLRLLVACTLLAMASSFVGFSWDQQARTSTITTRLSPLLAAQRPFNATAAELRATNRRRAEERRLKRAPKKVVQRQRMIKTNQAMLSRKRDEERMRLRGDGPVPRLPKTQEGRLEYLEIGQQLEGRVCRIVSYGVWVDVAAQVDGFLHVSDIQDGFVHHPADVLKPGQDLQLFVKHVDTADKRLGLSCLPVSSPYDGSERTPLEDLSEDEQLWGQVTRVTHFGAFMDVGAEKDAFLHVTEYPDRLVGHYGPDTFKRGQRLRVYVKEVDDEFNRVKLTSFRPRQLPHVPL